MVRRRSLLRCCALVWIEPRAFVHDLSPDNKLLPTPWQEQFQIAMRGVDLRTAALQFSAAPDVAAALGDWRYRRCSWNSRCTSGSARNQGCAYQTKRPGPCTKCGAGPSPKTHHGVLLFMAFPICRLGRPKASKRCRLKRKRNATPTPIAPGRERAREGEPGGVPGRGAP